MSDAQLERMTQMVNSDAATGVKDVVPPADNALSFTIELNSGHTLNELLPKGVKFVMDKKEPWYSPRRNIVHFNPELLSNQNYKATFAHECGHALVKNPKKTELTYLQTGHEILYHGQFRQLPLEERLKKISSLMRLDLENELDAMNNGKIVADLLDVDSTVYEDVATNGLQAHFWFTISYIGKMFELTCPDLRDDALVDYFNPFAQEVHQITYHEFKTMNSRAKEENAKAFAEANRKINHE